MGVLLLNYKEIQAFETALRKAIEQSKLQAAEALIRASVRDDPDELLREVLDRPLDRLHIRDWNNIGAELLRFHQLVERYVEDPGLPRPLRVFVRGNCRPADGDEHHRLRHSGDSIARCEHRTIRSGGDDASSRTRPC